MADRLFPYQNLSQHYSWLTPIEKKLKAAVTRFCWEELFTGCKFDVITEHGGRATYSYENLSDFFADFPGVEWLLHKEE